LIRRVSDSYLLHEHLEEVNAPIYFHQFVERATGKQLQYLAEAEVGSMLPTRFPPKVSGELQKMTSDLIEMEQVMDFLRNRRFRQTLLCHDHRTINRKLSPDRIMTLRLAAPLRPAAAKPTLASNAVEEFIGPKDRKVTTGDPLYKAALLCLAESWPRAVPFADLVAAARARPHRPR
jgi:methyltransferase-like protein